MLELGKAGSHGAPKGEAPILRDGAVVAVLRASNWKEAATAIIAGREWVFAKRKGELTARWAAEPALPSSSTVPPPQPMFGAPATLSPVARYSR